MKKLRVLKYLSLIIAILVSFSAVIGIFLIPIGFGLEKAVVSWLGIILVIHGFYGIIFYWIWFANTCRRYRVARAIEKFGITGAADIAENIHRNRDAVNRDIRWCIRKGYLKNCGFNGNAVIKNVKKD